ncbi:MAG: hypothetical protein OEO23_13285, partial [Gemmatimonadota bacterium]|nr:hypothetical protein [Gemmatimonadota bacterium]
MNGLFTAVTLSVLSFGQDALTQDQRSASSDGPEGAVATEFVGAAGQLEVPNPWVAESTGIEIDGSVDEALWLNAPVLTGFTQFDPVEGVPATQRTEARVLITPDAILFAVKAFDDT